MSTDVMEDSKDMKKMVKKSQRKVLTLRRLYKKHRRKQQRRNDIILHQSYINNYICILH